MSRNVQFPEKNRQENFPPAFPPVNALKKEFAQYAKGSTFLRIAPLWQFIPPSCLLQILASKIGMQRSPWLTCLAFLFSLSKMFSTSRIQFPYHGFTRIKLFQYFLGAMQIGEWGIWAQSLIYCFIWRAKPRGLIWVLRSTAPGIHIDRSPSKEGGWVADGFLK